MTKEEGNKLIGEFMGKSFKDPLNYMYDISWGWLMPVVEKIQKAKHLVSINFYSENDMPVECKIYNWGIGDPEQENESTSAIEAVWKTVVDHIIFLNSEQSVQVSDTTEAEKSGEAGKQI